MARNAQVDKWNRGFFIHERDLHTAANIYRDWELKALDLGYSETWINTPWPYTDSGKLVRYLDNPYIHER